jgi:hypothetical protein
MTRVSVNGGRSFTAAGLEPDEPANVGPRRAGRRAAEFAPLFGGVPGRLHRFRRETRLTYPDGREVPAYLLHIDGDRAGVMRAELRARGGLLQCAGDAEEFIVAVTA